MIPVGRNLTLYQGDSFDFTFRLRQKNSDGTAGDYVDLTGVTPKAQIRATQDDSAVLMEFTAALTSNPGEVTLTLTPTQTAALANGVWDVQLTFPDGQVKTYLAGTIKAIKEVTRA